MVNFDKFLASFITEIKKYQPITCYNLPGCIKKALEDQGFKYKDGVIVKNQRRISAEAKESGYNISDNNRIREALIHFFSNSENTSFEYWEGISKKEVLDWLKKQDQQEEPQVYEIEDGKVIIYSESEGYKVIEPKFKVGDWVVYNRDDYSREIIQVYDIRDGRYYFTDNVHFSWSIKECDEKSHLWSIKDAKEGDVLAADIIESYPSPFVAICKKQYGELFETYCFIGHDGKFYKGEIGHNGEYVHPATKEQRDMLFQKMHEAGYTFNFKKKELKNIHVIDEGKAEMDYCFTKMMNGEKVSSTCSKEIKSSDEFSGLTDFEKTLADICIGWIGEEPGWKQYIKDNADVLLKIAIEKFNSVQDISFEQKSTWGEEDEKMIECLNNCLDELETENGWNYIYVNDKNIKLNKVRNWVKSLKQRIGG